MAAAADDAQAEPPSAQPQTPGEPPTAQPRTPAEPPLAQDAHPARPTPLQRRWGLLTLAVAAEFVTLLLPRARATSFEGLATDATPGGPTALPAFTGLDFTLPAALELVLLALVLLTGFAIRLRPDLTRDLRPAAYALAAALPAWVTLTVLIPGLGADDAPAPADTLPAGHVAITAALAVGALLVALAHAPGPGPKPSPDAPHATAPTG